MIKKIISFLIIITLMVFQFMVFIPNAKAETDHVGSFELTTDEHGLVGYGFASCSSLYPFNHINTFYVYGRTNKTSDWLQLTYSDVEEDYNGWNYGFFVGDGKTNIPLSTLNQNSINNQDKTEVYNENAGLYSKINFEFHENGMLLKITYTITNKTNEEKQFGLWSGGDTMLDKDDGIDIYEFNENGIKGMYMKNDTAQFNIFSTSNDEDVDFWHGDFNVVRHKMGRNNLLYNSLIGENESVGEDSVSFWHWEDQTIKPNSSKNYSVYIGITEPNDNIIDKRTTDITREESGNTPEKNKIEKENNSNINDNTISNPQTGDKTVLYTILYIILIGLIIVGIITTKKHIKKKNN